MPAGRMYCIKCKHHYWAARETPEHKCPYCGWVLEDGEMEDAEVRELREVATENGEHGVVSGASMCPENQ